LHSVEIAQQALQPPLGRHQPYVARRDLPQIPLAPQEPGRVVLAEQRAADGDTCEHQQWAAEVANGDGTE
jgi:hypothetical protein